MQAIKQLGGGLLLGLISLAVVVGGISLALAEGYVPQPALFLASDTPGPDNLLPTSEIALTSFDFLLSPYPSDTPFATRELTATSTPIPPTNCPPPTGWVLIAVGQGETLEVIAARYQISVEALKQANCLVTTSLLPGYGLYVPPILTKTSLPCGAPAGWIQYTVQTGDNLFHIGQLYGTTVSELQKANCLGYSTTIYTGQKLWVPNVIPSTPIITATIINIEFDTVTPMPSSTPVPTNTTTPTATATAVPPTVTPSPSPTPSPTETPPPTSQ
jgi:LysM repeat protein